MAGIGADDGVVEAAFGPGDRGMAEPVGRDALAATPGVARQGVSRLAPCCGRANVRPTERRLWGWLLADPDRTLLVVSSRLAAIARADQVIVIRLDTDSS